MAWARIDDAMPAHRKFRHLDDAPAAWLWQAGVCFASKYLTDGFLDERDVAGGLESAIRLRSPLKLAERLVAVGLWERVEGGFQVHDYLDYNPSREQVLADRQRHRDRQASYRQRQRDASRDASPTASPTGHSTVRDASRADGPSRPVPSRPQNPAARASDDDERERAEDQEPVYHDAVLDAFRELFGPDPDHPRPTGRDDAARDIRDALEYRPIQAGRYVRVRQLVIDTAERFRAEHADAELTPHAVARYLDDDHVEGSR